MIFHREIGFPKSAESLYGKKFKLVYSIHAKLACINEKYGVLDKPPFEIILNKDNLIEVELTNNLISKIVVRLPYDDIKDVALAIIPEDNIGAVKSIWANLKTDKHFTLKKELYNKP